MPTLSPFLSQSSTLTMPPSMASRGQWWPPPSPMSPRRPPVLHLGMHPAVPNNFPIFENSLRAQLTQAQRVRAEGGSPRSRAQVAMEARLVNSGNAEQLAFLAGVPIEALFTMERPQSGRRRGPNLGLTPPPMLPPAVRATRAASARGPRPRPMAGVRMGRLLDDPEHLDEVSLADRLKNALGAQAGPKQQLLRIAELYHKANRDDTGGLNRKELADLILRAGIDLQQGEIDELLREVYVAQNRTHPQRVCLLGRPLLIQLLTRTEYKGALTPPLTCLP